MEHVQEACGQVTAVVGLESRGFIFGPMMAERLQVAFVPVRKQGKLPGECVSVSFNLEYGKVSKFVPYTCMYSHLTVTCDDIVM